MVALSCRALCEPTYCSPPGFSVCAIFQARILEWGCHFLLQRIFPTQRWNLCPLHWQVDSRSLNHQGSPSLIFEVKKKKKVYFGIKIAKTSKEKPTPGFPVGKGLDLVEGCLRITNKPISGLRGLRTDGPAKGARLTLPKLWVQRPGIQALNQSFCVLTLMC